MSEETDTDWRKGGRCSSCTLFTTDFGSAPEFYGHCKMHTRSGSRKSTDFACDEYDPMKGFAALTRSADHDRHFTDPTLIEQAKKEKKPAARKKKRATTRKPTKAEERAALSMAERLAAWQSAVGARTLDDAERYDVRKTFEEGALIDHAKYELGVVTRELPGNKLTVLFRDGERTLIHRHGQS